MVIPSENASTLGAGVHQTTEGIDFKFVRLPEYKTWYGKPFYKDIDKLLKEEKPDIIVTGWPYILGFTYGLSLRSLLKKLKIKLIYKDIPFNIPKFQESTRYYKEQQLQLESKDKKKKKYTLADFFIYEVVKYSRKLFLNKADAHIYYTHDAYEIIGSYGVSKDKMFIAANSPDTDLLLEAKQKASVLPPILPPNNFRLLHVGRLVEWKRVDLIIQVLSRLRSKFPEAELIIIGSGPEETNLKNQVKKLQLEDHVKFTGAIYDPVLLGRYFLSSSIYVLGGMGGLSINEAMAFGKPVVCSVCDGTEKILVREDYNGKYFKNHDENDLYSKLDYLLSRQDLIKKFGENSEKIITNEVNIHTVVKEYIKAFNYVTSSNN